MQQFVYRLDLDDPGALPAPRDLPDGYRYADCPCFGPSLGILGPLRRSFGPRGAVVTCLKTATARRSFAGIIAGGRVVSYAWLSHGWCNYYDVEADAIVIGPVMTNADQRGKGLATCLLHRLLRDAAGRGCRRFYIDTAEDNLAMQKVIERCGFGPPSHTFPRADS